ncbi:tubulin polyglutamylase TTLL5 [Natronocella acetinitrilica]|uniref:Tubulin polyglutamylase TTLL5 n=1 Tax=Natronocella acetinitrilica TaxID=414046 RepID=A0AAE3G8P4_9GAMM|nr:tubulin--tyrosine ligase family protein [Natronocella acetinitrilica]MCP1676513.1 tubulin polyglutamylase TTLL5 [Natronocella acetinitrilica]
MVGKQSARRMWLGGKREPEQDRFFKEALTANRWTSGDEQNWDTCWYTGMPKPSAFEKLTDGKTINHIPGNNALTIKSRLYQTLSATRQRIAEQEGADSPNARRMRFFPETYIMPGDYHALIRDAHAHPERRYIRKPKNAARGKDIAVVQDIATVPVGDRWLVQRYLDNPHTIDGHKYVLRLYVLITSVVPLRVYLFREGSTKLASDVFDLNDLANPYAHLTNPDINATNQNSTTPVVFLSLATYRKWLKEQGHDDDALFERLRDLVTLTVISAREAMLERTRSVKADTSGCYELLGLDCLVDANLNPWILECNLSPSLEVCAAPKDGGDVEENMKRRLVADMVNLVGINQPSRTPSGKTPEQRLISASEQEAARAGDYQRIYPPADVERYLPYFPLPRAEDMILADWAAGRRLDRPILRAHRTAEIIGSDSLALYAEDSGTLYTPNPAAGWIWLKATDGSDPDNITDELLAARGNAGAPLAPEAAWEQRRDTWNLLADWAASGLLRQVATAHTTVSSSHHDSEKSTRTSARKSVDIGVRIGAFTSIITVPQLLASRIEGSFLQLAETVTGDHAALRVVESRVGYAVTTDQSVLTSGLTLGELVPVLYRLLLRDMVATADRTCIGGTLVPLQARAAGPSSALLVADGPESIQDTLAVTMGRLIGYGHSGGFWLPDDASPISPAGLAARIPESARDDLRRALPLDRDIVSPFLHTWGASNPFRLALPNDSLKTQQFDVVAVVRPVMAQDSDGSAAELRPTAVQHVVAACLQSSLGRQGRSPDTSDMTALADWLEERPMFDLPVQELGDTATRLFQWLQDRRAVTA